ncbi:adhesion G-protein coupled receptor G6 isoform X2 [Lepisosteus oculatus]|uniref:adhesion G-protein coupled receptor G6 isoform X2 n=1 Tax=Lepisosteus oculatus TaxID=7918 RepID=UPI0035F518F2
MKSFIRGGWWRWKFRNILYSIAVLLMCLQKTVLSCQVDCNKVLTASSGFFTSPCYPSEYPKSQACKWTLQAPAGFIVQITFCDFELEEALGCIYDRVIVSNGKSEVTFCGITANGLSFNSTGNVMNVSFNSDFSVQKKGFNITYRQVAVSLRNQKVSLKQNKAYIESAPQVTIPVLRQFTTCFEAAKSGRVNKDWMVYSYMDSSSNDILTFVISGTYTALTVLNQTCMLTNILSESDFSLQMTLFCLTWDSTTGNTAVYTGGNYKTSLCGNTKGKIPQSNGMFVLGSKNGNMDAFSGDIYNFRLWDSAKSKQQLSSLTCDVKGSILDWENEFWVIPASYIKTDSTLSCICYPSCSHLTTATPSRGTSIVSPSAAPTASCTSSGLGCPATLTPTTTSFVTTNMTDTNPASHGNDTLTDLWLSFNFTESEVAGSTPPQSRSHVIQGPRSLKTSLGIISTPLIWPNRKKPDIVTQRQEKPVIHLTKPPITDANHTTAVPSKPKVATTHSVARKTKEIPHDTTHSEVAFPWQPMDSQNRSDDIESFQAASLSNRKNKPLVPYWTLNTDSENKTLNWTDASEYPSGSEPAVYDIETFSGMETFSFYDMDSSYKVNASSVSVPHNASKNAPIVTKEELSQMTYSARSYLLAESSLRVAQSRFVEIHLFNRVLEGTGVQTPSQRLSTISQATANMNFQTNQAALPSTSLDFIQHLRAESQTQILSFNPSGASVPHGLSTGIIPNYQETVMSVSGKEHHEESSSFDNFSKELTRSPFLYKNDISTFRKDTAYFGNIKSDAMLPSNSVTIQPSQTLTEHLKNSEAILKASAGIQSEVLIIEPSRPNILLLSDMSEVFPSLIHDFMETTLTSYDTDYSSLLLPSLKHQLEFTGNSHTEDQRLPIYQSSFPSNLKPDNTIIMSETISDSEMSFFLSSEQSNINSSTELLFSSLTGYNSNNPSDSGLKELSPKAHIYFSAVTHLTYKALESMKNELTDLQFLPFNAFSKIKGGTAQYTFSTDSFLSETSILPENVFEELANSFSMNLTTGIIEDESIYSMVQVYLSFLSASSAYLTGRAHSESIYSLTLREISTSFHGLQGTPYNVNELENASKKKTIVSQDYFYSGVQPPPSSSFLGSSSAFSHLSHELLQHPYISSSTKTNLQSTPTNLNSRITSQGLLPEIYSDMTWYSQESQSVSSESYMNLSQLSEPFQFKEQNQFSYPTHLLEMTSVEPTAAPQHMATIFKTPVSNEVIMQESSILSMKMQPASGPVWSTRSSGAVESESPVAKDVMASSELNLLLSGSMLAGNVQFEISAEDDKSDEKWDDGLVLTSLDQDLPMASASLVVQTPASYAELVYNKTSTEDHLSGSTKDPHILNMLGSGISGENIDLQLGNTTGSQTTMGVTEVTLCLCKDHFDNSCLCGFSTSNRML